MKTNTHNEHDTAATQHTAEHSVVSTRRRLIGGAAGGVGVLMAVSAKTALGTTVCQSPSAMVSGNASPRPDGPQPCSGGRSPGFWRNPQHFNAWTSAGGYAAVPPTLKDVSSCPTGLGGIGPENITAQGTSIQEVFGSPGLSVLKNYSHTAKDRSSTYISASDWGVWAVLAFPKDVGINEGHLLWHLCAAYLNALAFDDYAMTPAQVVEAGQSLLTGGVWCPSGMSNAVCTTNAMTPSDFVSYISGMYDFNAELELNLCKSK